MKILAIHAGGVRKVPWRGRLVSTGFFKRAVRRPIPVGRLGLFGDTQADPRYHGGPEKAVYGYGADAYEWWKTELGVKRLAYGSFGENLTLDALDESKLCVGDVLAAGDCRLQVVQPRLPCFKLGIKFGDQRLVKTFMRSRRPGIYFRVLSEGKIFPGESVEVVERDPEHLSLLALMDLMMFAAVDQDELARALRIKSLSPQRRPELEKKLR